MKRGFRSMASCDAFNEYVRLAREGEKPICNCSICGEEFFFGDECYKYEDQMYCEDCFSNITEDMKYTVTDDDIEEPSWEDFSEE